MKPENAPPWMQAEYTVWYRDPCMLFKNMLENPEFAGHSTMHHFDDMIPKVIMYMNTLCQVIQHGSRLYVILV